MHSTTILYSELFMLNSSTEILARAYASWLHNGWLESCNVDQAILLSESLFVGGGPGVHASEVSYEFT